MCATSKAPVHGSARQGRCGRAANLSWAGAVDQPIPLDDLPPPYRLALAYAPGAARPALAALLALDLRLGRIGQQAGEPLIAQLKLAWWRDQFGKPVPEWPVGEPLLGSLGALGFAGADLVELVDGWETVTVGEVVGEEELAALARGRAAAWRASSRLLDEREQGDAIAHAAKLWTAGEVGSRALGDRALPSLPRHMRPLAILAALGRRACERDEPLLDGPAAMALAMRVGIFGR